MGAGVSDSAVAKAAAQNGRASDPALVTLSTGVVLRVKHVPGGIFADLMADIEPPKVPTVWIAEKGRQEENPDDPDYITDKQVYLARQAKAMSDAVVVLGTELESAPKGFPGPKDKEWNAQMVALGRRFNSEQDQYLAWVKYKAGGEPTDFEEIWAAVGRQAGVLEEDARAATAQFPRGARRKRHR